MELVNLESEPVRIAAQRSRLYQLLTIAFGFPDEEFYSAVRDGSFLRVVTDLSVGLPYELTDVATLGLATGGESQTEFESEYIRLFDVGAAGPPCPLYGGVYAGDRMKTMEDATRFYHFFQLRLSPELRELPDHITTELEFLHYLTFREAEARQNDSDASPLLRAQRDFLERHLCRWLPRLEGRLAKQQTLPFFPALVRFACAFFQRDQAYVSAAAEQWPVNR